MSQFTTRISAYLQILGRFDGRVVTDLERELTDALKAAGLSVSRYRRYKTDTTGDTPLFHTEAEFLYNFFVKKFTEAMAGAEDATYHNTLSNWMPTSALEIYWETVPLHAVGVDSWNGAVSA